MFSCLAWIFSGVFLVRGPNTLLFILSAAWLFLNRGEVGHNRAGLEELSLLSLNRIIH